MEALFRVIALKWNKVSEGYNHWVFIYTLHKSSLRLADWHEFSSLPSYFVMLYQNVQFDTLC